MSYEIFYYLTDDVDLTREHFEQKMNLKCDVQSGTLTLEDEELVIEAKKEGVPGIRVPYREIYATPQYFRLHFLCRMLEIPYFASRDAVPIKRKIYVTTSLIAAAGRPVVTNFISLMRLQSELDGRVRRVWVSA